MPGRRVWVVGASNGIGRALAEHLVASGDHVVVSARDERRLSQIGGARESIVVDLAEVDSLRSAADRAAGAVGALDAVAVCAGEIEPIARVADFDSARWVRAITIGLVAPMALAHASLRHLRRGIAPVFLVLTSGAALAPVPGWSAYCSAKAALNAGLRVLAEEWREYDVRVHGVYPGAVDTDMQRTIRDKGKAAMGPAWDYYADLWAAGSLKPSTDVAAAICRLLQPRAAVTELPVLIHVNDI